MAAVLAAPSLRWSRPWRRSWRALRAIPPGPHGGHAHW